MAGATQKSEIKYLPATHPELNKGWWTWENGADSTRLDNLGSDLVVPLKEWVWDMAL